MKIAIVLSGSVREPSNSLASAGMFAGHDVSTFIHTWRNVTAIQDESFSKRPNLEPDSKLLTSYPDAHIRTDDWEEWRTKFRADVDVWQKLPCWNARPEHQNNIGFHGMYFSLKRASEYVLDHILDYDLIVRLRFDCRLIDNPLNVPTEAGWTMPSGFDYFGLNDQLGWFKPYSGDEWKSKFEAGAYLSVYGSMDGMIRGGCSHTPEVLLKTNFDVLGVPVKKVKLEYTIR